MTLLLAVGSPVVAVLTSDRRLVVNDRPYDELANKATYLVTYDARVAFGYTGFAGHLRGFASQAWLLDALARCLPPDFQIGPVLERLRTVANTEVPRNSCRFTVLFTGFRYLMRSEDVAEPRSIFACLTDDPAYRLIGRDPTAGRFKLVFLTATKPGNYSMSYIEPAGTTAALVGAELEYTRQMVVQARPKAQVRNRMVALMRRAAAAPQSMNYIGPDYTSIIITADLNEPAHAEYHPPRNTRFPAPTTSTYYLPAYVAPPGLTVSGGQVVPVIPRVPRDAECPCGSLFRFERCHWPGTSRS